MRRQRGARRDESGFIRSRGQTADARRQYRVQRKETAKYPTSDVWRLASSTFFENSSPLYPKKLLCDQIIFLTLVTSIVALVSARLSRTAFFVEESLWQFGSDSPLISNLRRRLLQPGGNPNPPRPPSLPVGLSDKTFRNQTCTPSGMS